MGTSGGRKAPGESRLCACPRDAFSGGWREDALVDESRGGAGGRAGCGPVPDQGEGLCPQMGHGCSALVGFQGGGCGNPAKGKGEWAGPWDSASEQGCREEGLGSRKAGGGRQQRLSALTCRASTCRAKGTGGARFPRLSWPPGERLGGAVPFTPHLWIGISARALGDRQARSIAPV